MEEKKQPIKFANYKNDLKRSSLLITKDYNNEKQQYPNIYQSNYRASITSLGFYEDQKRTESYSKNLEDSDFVKEQKISNKRIKNPHSTQKFNLRKVSSPLEALKRKKVQKPVVK